VFDSEDVVFAWAIGKALLIVIVSVGALVYVAWVVTRKREIAPRVEIPENAALRSSAVKASNMPFSGLEKTGAAEGARPILSGTSREENNTRKAEQPPAAA
jgi:hypothetical protein